MVGTAIKNREAELDTFRNRALVAGLVIMVAFGLTQSAHVHRPR